MFAFILAVSGLPLMVSAEGKRGQDPEVSIGDFEQKQIEEQNRQNSPVEMFAGERSKEGAKVEGRDEYEISEIDFELEDDESPAFSFDDLKQKIEKRKHELEKEVASSSPKHKEIIENANEVRLAVHSLLASKELLGGIGSQVSEIAKKMNDSVATTTNAEAKIQSRGFFVRLFLGGDKTSAEVIVQEASQNQKRIANLTELFGKVNVPTDVQAILKEQITALETVQTHLQDLAQKEKSAWGIFSWRF